MAAKWRTIGVRLGVPTHELDTIQQNNSGHVDMCQDCLTAMFSWWLKNVEECTANKLAQAVHAAGNLDRAHLKILWNLSKHRFVFKKNS